MYKKGGVAEKIDKTNDCYKLFLVGGGEGREGLDLYELVCCILLQMLLHSRERGLTDVINY